MTRRYQPEKDYWLCPCCQAHVPGPWAGQMVVQECSNCDWIGVGYWAIRCRTHEEAR